MSLGSQGSFFLGSSGQGGGGYAIERSLRFNPGDSASLTKTFSATGNQTTYTLSFWLKKNNSSSVYQNILIDNNSTGNQIRINDTTGGFQCRFAAASGANLSTNRMFRDTSAWYHFVFVYDSTNATSSDRMRIYVNGVRETSFLAENQPSQNLASSFFTNGNTYTIGHYNANTALDGYLADIHFIDGQALAASDFGKYDSNSVWQPKEFAGTYGTNGFKLDFSDGVKDQSGLGNDWTANNIGPAGGNVNRTSELSENHASGSVALPYRAFDAAYISSKVNTSTWAITSTAWVGSYSAAYAELRWIPTGGYAVSNSLRVYYGCYDNTTKTTTLTITYTDNSTETDSMTSGNNNWMKLFTASNAAGKTIQKIELSPSTPSLTNIQFGGFVIDNAIVESSNPDSDFFVDSPVNGNSANDTGAGGEITGNYATWNPLVVTASGRTYSDGNLKCVTGIAEYRIIVPTIYYPTGYGKWYCEITVENLTADTVIGAIYASAINGAVNQAPGYVTNSVSYQFNGNKVQNSSSSAYGASYTDGDIIGVAFDAENGSITFYKNGVSQGVAFSSLSTVDQWALAASDFDNTASGTGTYVLNAGQRAFAYAAPSGYKALCTTNLPDPTIADGSDYFDVSLWVGNSGTTTISGLEFSPDWAWLKSRSTATYAILQDTVRGYDKALYLGGVAGDDAEATITDSVTSFNSDGYTLGSRSIINYTGRTYVGWAWDAGSSTVSNTDGSITSSVRANQTAGFSIVSYTGTGSAATVGHGLNAAPEMIILKDRNATAKWKVLHVGAVSGTDPYYQNVLHLDTDEAFTGTGNSYPWGGTAPTSSVFSVANVGTEANRSGSINNTNYIAYCFSSVEQYSSFGSYLGNGSIDGSFVYTGMRPSWILLKNITNAYSWYLYDTTRGTFNVVETALFPNSAGADTVDAAYAIDILSNGFKLRNSNIRSNGSSNTYIYAAFAENPQKYSRAR